MADRFYTNSALGPGPFVLQGAEAHHLATVRRFRTGDRVILFNGDGQEYPAEIVSADRKSVALNVVAVERPLREPPFRLIVASVLPKGDRGDFLIEKLTELGVTELVPLRTERAVVLPRENKLERLQRVVVEASKQCGRNVLMRIRELAEWNEFCRRAELPPLRLLAHTADGEMLPDEIGTCDVCCAVGPEGGFTDGETAAGRAAGWRSVSLGPRILRVETAAIALAVACGLTGR